MMSNCHIDPLVMVARNLDKSLQHIDLEKTVVKLAISLFNLFFINLAISRSCKNICLNCFMMMLDIRS